MTLRTTGRATVALGFLHLFGPSACGSTPLGDATVTGPQEMVVTNAWAFHPPPVPNYSYDLSTNPKVLEIMMSDGPSLSCATVQSLTSGAIDAVVFAAFPKDGESSVGPGTYPIVSTSQSRGPFALSQRFACGGGTGGCIGTSLVVSGSLTITSVGESTQGSFTVEYQGDTAPTRGTFSVQTCD
jgi:hypothetical protein